jgi:hypothetical protein
MDAGLIKILRHYSFRAKRSVRGANLLYERVSFADIDPAEGTIWKRYFFEANPQSAEPLTGNLLLNGVAPSVSITDNTVVSPGVGNLLLTGLSPTPLISVTVYPLQGNLVLNGVAPSAVVSENITVFPQAGNLTLTGFAPAFEQSVLVSPETASLILSGNRPDAIGVGYYRDNIVNATVSVSGEYDVSETVTRSSEYIVSSTIVRPTENIIQ